MKLPNADRAIVDRRKIVDYCLNPEHDDGVHKARLFQVIVGVNRENSGLLIDALQRAAVVGDAIPGTGDKYGQRYTVDFEFEGPGGTAVVRSAWIVRTGETLPRLVTCYIRSMETILDPG